MNRIKSSALCFIPVGYYDARLLHVHQILSRTPLEFPLKSMEYKHQNVSDGLLCDCVFVCLRGGGVGLVLASAGFGMLTAPLMELHNQKGFFLHHVILTCCTLLCIICIPLLPETRGQPLPETIAEGEGMQRRPLLTGEQHHLLARTDVREYSRVQDTPLHQAVNPGNGTVPSNSTANGMRTS